MIEITKRGRLGNVLFQNCAASVLSKKFDIKVAAYYENCCAALKPNFYKHGKRIYSEKVVVSDRNFLEILESDKIESGLSLQGFFQKKRFVLKYRSQILEIFAPDELLQKPPGLFVHVRLGDAEGRNPGIEYYIKAINSIGCYGGYVSSDSPGHDMVRRLSDMFGLLIYNGCPAETINFGKKFSNIVLSGGTFSWWIGFLSSAKNIYYPVPRTRWHGDIFVYDWWKPIPSS